MSVCLSVCLSVCVCVCVGMWRLWVCVCVGMWRLWVCACVRACGHIRIRVEPFRYNAAQFKLDYTLMWQLHDLTHFWKCLEHILCVHKFDDMKCTSSAYMYTWDNKSAAMCIIVCTKSMHASVVNVNCNHAFCFAPACIFSTHFTCFIFGVYSGLILYNSLGNCTLASNYNASGVASSS